MERPAVIRDGRQTVPGLKIGGPGAEPGLLSRYTVFRAMRGEVLILQDKQTGDRLKLSMRDLDGEMLETEAGFVEAIERLLMAKRCISCSVELVEGEFGLCGSCHANRRDALIGLHADLRR